MIPRVLSFFNNTLGAFLLLKFTFYHFKFSNILECYIHEHGSCNMYSQFNLFGVKALCLMVFIIAEFNDEIYVCCKLLVCSLLAVFQLIELHAVDGIAQCSMFCIAILVSYFFIIYEIMQLLQI